MVSRYRNKAKYLDERDKAAAQAERDWRAATAVPGWDVYDRADRGLGSKSINADDVKIILGYLADITGDPVFEDAKQVFASYDLKGGLEQSVRKLVKASDQYLGHMLAPMIEDIIVRGTSTSTGSKKVSVYAAAKTVAIALGVPGVNLKAVVDELRRAYPVWKTNGAPPMPSGDTGERIKVQLGPALSQLGRGTNLVGCNFDDNGVGIVPDDRRWRILLHLGRVTLLGRAGRSFSDEESEFIETDLEEINPQSQEM